MIMMTNISGWWQWWKWQIWFCMNNNDGGNKNDQAAYHPLKCGFPIHFHVHFPTYLMVSEGHQSHQWWWLRSPVMMVDITSDDGWDHQWWWLRSLKVQSITMITMLMMMMGITVHDLENKRLEWSYYKIVLQDCKLWWWFMLNISKPITTGMYAMHMDNVHYTYTCTCTMCIALHMHRHVWEHSECSWGKVGGLL